MVLWEVKDPVRLLKHEVATRKCGRDKIKKKHTKEAPALRAVN